MGCERVRGVKAKGCMRIPQDSPYHAISNIDFRIYDISLFKLVSYFNIPFVFLNTWRTLFTIFKISQYVFIEILKFEVNITSLY
jgi:hypothetical protein